MRHRRLESEAPESRLVEIEWDLAAMCHRFRGAGTLLAPAEVLAALRECRDLYERIESVRNELVSRG
jgi:hypothetical protein